MTSEFEVVKPFRHARTMRAAGERLSLSAAQAQFLVLGGLVRPVVAPEPAPAAKRAIVAANATALFLVGDALVVGSGTEPYDHITLALEIP